MQGHQQPQPGLQRESSMLQRDSDRLHVPGNRMNDGSLSARSSWHSVIAKALPAHHQSTPALAISGLSNSTKTLRDDWDHHSTPHTPTFSSFPGMGFPPTDPDMGLQREKSFEPCQDLTPEGLSWKRLHMSRAKLKATATTSELLSGFAMVAMVELQINTPTNVPEWLFVLFAVCTTVLVSVHIFALMISTYILPNVDAVSKMQHVASSISKRASLNGGYQKLGVMGEHSNHSSMANILESPHERMRNFIELAWAFSTVLGLFLFLVELAILCWVKFWDYSFTAAWSATIIVIPVLVIFVIFVAHFYRSLVEQKVVSTTSNLHDLEAMRNTLHDVEVGCYENSGCPTPIPGITAPPSPVPSLLLCPPSPSQQYSPYLPPHGPLLVVPDTQSKFCPNIPVQRPTTPTQTKLPV